MGMKYKDPVTGQLKELSLKAADTLPIGTVVEYDGETVPDGWEEVSEDYEENLIASIVLKEDSVKMQLSNLNLQPGKAYRIVIAEFSKTQTSNGHYIGINDKVDGYTGQILVSRNIGTQPEINGTSITKGLGLSNGWAKGTILFYTSGIIEYFNKDWIGCQLISNAENLVITQGGYLKNANIQSIDSIEVRCLDSDKIGTGSWMKLYKMD